MMMLMMLMLTPPLQLQATNAPSLAWLHFPQVPVGYNSKMLMTSGILNGLAVDYRKVSEML
jgi:hypothetical protein